MFGGGDIKNMSRSISKESLENSNKSMRDEFRGDRSRGMSKHSSFRHKS